MRAMLRILAAASLALTGLAGAKAQDPEALIKETTQGVLQVVQEQEAEFEENPKALYQLVDELVLPVIDFESMAKLTLGLHWRRASPEQRERFVEEFRTMLVRTYTKSLLEYADASIEYLGARGRDDRYTTVRTEVEPGQGQRDVPMHYSLRRGEDGWQIYDVTIDGLSLVKNYRTSFDKEVDQKGLQALIERLARNNAEGEVPELGGGDEDAESKGGKGEGTAAAQGEGSSADADGQ